MPTSNQYKLLRTGGVRTGAARGMSRSGRYALTANVLAPNIEDFGHRPFSAQALPALALRLQNPIWPRGSLSVLGIEGLLTALLVLPLGLRPGAWLPLVWNESGWKVPAPLQGAEQLGEFVELLMGFMRYLDRQLSETPPRFTSTLDSATGLPNATREWSQGFGRVMAQSNYLKVLPDSVAHRALYAIATQANTTGVDVRRSHESATIQQAVLALARTRTTRGPLGPLPAPPKVSRGPKTRPSAS